MKNWELTGEAFDLFLSWLDTDREDAALKYEALRRRLIVFFDCRGCADSEDLADETINRVIRQTPDLIDSFQGDPVHRLYGVAKFIHREYLSNRVKKDGGEVPADFPDPHPEPDSSEQKSRCLEQCLQRLSDDDRALVMQYYAQDKQAKIDHRKWLAEQIGCAPGTLRTRMNRLRKQLQECITSCQCKESGM